MGHMAARTSNRLNSRFVKSDLEPGRYADGNSLYLFVREGGTKQWVVRTMVQRKRRDIGLGGFPLVTLAEAREQATEVLRQARRGIDPIAERRKMKAIPTFKSAANAVLEERKPSWKNKKHAQQWTNTLKTYASPTIGKMPLEDITSLHVLKILKPIWVTKHETASRVRQRLERIFSYSIASKYMKSPNPAAYKDNLQHLLPKVSKTANVKHMRSLDYYELPNLINELFELKTTSSLALIFKISTAARTSEVIGAQWNETLKTYLPEFHKKTVPHGLRSSFRNWAEENYNFSRRAVELCLSHTNKNKVENAYLRSNLFGKRQQIMSEWNKFLQK